MTRLTAQHSIKTEKLEAKLAGNGSYNQSSMTVANGKLYLGDGRVQPLTNRNLIADVNAWSQGKIYGASGDLDKLDKLRIYGAAYYDMIEGYNSIKKTLDENPYLTAQHVALSGAAGEEAITQYEAVRKAATILGDISGQQRIAEDLNATNIADMVNTQDLKVEFLRKTSAVNSVDKELADDQLPSDIRSVFAVGTFELFADGVSYQTNLRDKELKVNVAAEIQKELPLMFQQAKHDKVITLVNAITGTNQGDWDARDATHGFFTTKAGTQVQAAEDAVKAYGGDLVCLMPSDTWRLYQENVGQTYHFDTRPANQSTNTPANKSGTLAANPSIKYWITDDLTTQTYAVAAKQSYMKFIQGMVIDTTFTDSRTAGQTSWNFRFDFNGAFENETSAVFKGTSVGA